MEAGGLSQPRYGVQAAVYIYRFDTFLLQVKRFSLHSKAVKHISFDDKAEYFASCCGDNYISVGYTTVTAPHAAAADTLVDLGRASVSSILPGFLA